MPAPRCTTIAIRTAWRASAVVGLLALGLLISSTPAAAQDLAPAGSEQTLDVATWNIEWFGSEHAAPTDDELQFETVRAVIEQAAVDVWALQEIADPADFHRLLDSLGAGYGGVLGKQPLFGGQQRLAFIYRTQVVDLLSWEHLFDNEEDAHAFGYRPPLQIKVEAALPSDTAELTLLTLHAKCCSDADEHERRAEGAQLIKNRIDFLRPNEPIIILGDFNDELDSSIRFGEDSPYAAFVADTADYVAATLHLEEGDELPTFCENSSCTDGSTLDHIMLTDELAPSYVSSDRYTAPLDANTRYIYETSDHLPVVAHFRFATDSAVEPARTLPDRLSFEAPVPNPFRQSLTLRYELAEPAEARIEVFDALGRRVALLTDAYRRSGPHVRVFAPEALPAGLYVVRITAGSESHVQRVVHL